MPTVSVAELTARAVTLLRGAGAPEDVAQLAADAIVGADVVGHDSHGVPQLPGYLAAVKAGRIVPDARPRALKETDTTALLDAQKGFGHYSATVAIDAAIVPTQDGVDEVLLPGERAARTAAQRRREGIPVPEDVWAALQAA